MDNGVSDPSTHLTMKITNPRRRAQVSTTPWLLLDGEGLTIINLPCLLVYNTAGVEHLTPVLNWYSLSAAYPFHWTF